MTTVVRRPCTPLLFFLKQVTMSSYTTTYRILTLVSLTESKRLLVNGRFLLRVISEMKLLLRKRCRSQNLMLLFILLD